MSDTNKNDTRLASNSPSADPASDVPIHIRHKLHSFDEFSRLRAIIVGNPIGANHPPIDDSFENFFQPPPDTNLRQLATGPISEFVINEIQEDIAGFIRALRAHDIEVIQSSPNDSTKQICTPYWETSQLYSLMPRDCLLVVGDIVIETASPTRARLFESFAFRDILEKYTQLGAHLISMPRPLLTAESFNQKCPYYITEAEPLLDAANCVRMGLDIFVDVNRSANYRAVKWLERTLHAFIDSRIRVTPMTLGTDHVDVTLIPLKPGVVLIDPTKVNEDNIPRQFKSWEKIVVEEVMPARDYGLPYPLASNDGIGRNILKINSDTVVVDEIQLPLIRKLEKLHFTVIALPYRHGRTLGGSWHCITLDTHRDGELVSYF